MTHLRVVCTNEIQYEILEMEPSDVMDALTQYREGEATLAFSLNNDVNLMAYINRDHIIALEIMDESKEEGS